MLCLGTSSDSNRPRPTYWIGENIKEVIIQTTKDQTINQIKKKKTNVKITKRQNQNYKTPVKHNHRIGNFPDVAVKEFNLFRKRIPHAEHSDHR
jgi:hypothetical protein